jgi:histidinol-phosphate/aromatic aminotransferase/cobyric acid decarboxylase-like protein
MSSLTAIAATALLASPRLPALLQLNSERLLEAYTRITLFLRKHGFVYIPANIGPFLFARLVPNAEGWEDEFDVVSACKAAGIIISAGRSYHVNKNQKG